RDRAAVFLHHREHGGVDLVPTREELLLIGADRLIDIVVNVAIAEMAEGQRPRPGNERGHRSVGVTDESRRGGDRDGNIVLDRAAGEALHLAEHFAYAPKRLALFDAVGDGGVAYEPALQPLGEHRFEHLTQTFAPLRR